MSLIARFKAANEALKSSRKAPSRAQKDVQSKEPKKLQQTSLKDFYGAGARAVSAINASEPIPINDVVGGESTTHTH